MKRRRAALALALLMLLLIVPLAVRETAQFSTEKFNFATGTPASAIAASTTANAVPIRIGAPGGPMIERVPLPKASARAQNPSAALARAVAAAGMAMDRGEPLPALDAAASARLDEARELLRQAAGQRKLRARASVGGSAERVEPGTTSTAAASPQSDDPAPRLRDLPPARLDPTTLPDAATLRATAAGPELTAPGLWARVDYRPDAFPGRGMTIANLSAGDYAISLNGGENADFSTVRLDGGLVVPGRFYRVRGGAVVTGETQVSVHIRPLDAVPAYEERPLPAPDGNG